MINMLMLKFFEKLFTLVSEITKDSKKRAENWTLEQIGLLVKLYNENKRLLDGKFSPSISKLTKDDAWSKIADQVSLVGSDRTVLQCKKKLSDQKSESKGKAARIISSLNKTGGGEGCLEELNSIDQQMVSKMPKVSYMGITGGIDYLQSPTTSNNDFIFQQISGSFSLQPKEQTVDHNNMQSSDCNDNEIYKENIVQTSSKESKKTPLLHDTSSITKELLSSTASTSSPTFLTIQDKTSVESIFTKQNVECKQSLKSSKKRKLSPSNVDNYMINMSKLGQQIIETGQQIASALKPTILTDQPLLESIGDTLRCIAESTKSLAESSEKMTNSLKEIASAISNN
ncbi:uncharacterized protein LOC136087541 [Hydra vulgaris]|uniref:Uncharacterized protein LOC136087541 n=1 Tax=Hydra vulgaris TaxID=6087 RepID=A0ABM4CXH0_HYDVU